jgi:hypothetical protein
LLALNRRFPIRVPRACNAWPVHLQNILVVTRARSVSNLSFTFCAAQQQL